ncbi:glycerophosphodiester phosphodiesterase [Pseudoxanthomonas sp. Root630]|uniref:glycerophosphodiester phosphodiesterase n=1 Tax=Pseudoxanthomonas sp. Root630 TaxID=1736574 RepID=UPI0007032487|nr:glycerophosphodiester phosphodiesterase [Pseudoxanthomonas sp. Root630]KRA43056.1 glycerophosphodiester phosphodiesterase [Pseudoxanthomonas sp. Root630]
MPVSPVLASESPVTPLVIGHRGASALLPEHTLAAYARAIADGADYIEPDLVATRDGVLVARHENEIGGTTDVAQRPEFAARKRRQVIDGETFEGWFTEDFTLAELKTLRARERLPELRGTAHDGHYEVATLDEVIALASEQAALRDRTIGLIPEIKHPSHFQRIGLPMEERLLQTLAAHAYTRQAPVVIQSFEQTNLRALRERLGATHPNIRLLQLLGPAEASPGDALAAGIARRYADLMTPEGLREIAAYADLLGPWTRSLIPHAADGTLGTPTDLMRDARAAGLPVWPYTFRPENAFLPRALRRGDDPRMRHDDGAIEEIRAYLALGIGGFFTDDPAVGRRAVDGR